MPGSGQDANTDVPKKSGPSQIMSKVTFVNRTERDVEILWMNYKGEGERLSILGPGRTLLVNTFVGHPWLFRDALTGDTLVVQSQQVFLPREPAEGVPAPRRLVYITIPVYTLLERSMQVIRRLCPREAIPTLEIPHHLRELLSGLT